MKLKIIGQVIVAVAVAYMFIAAALMAAIGYFSRYYSTVDGPELWNEP